MVVNEQAVEQLRRDVTEAMERVNEWQQRDNETVEESMVRMEEEGFLMGVTHALRTLGIDWRAGQ